MIDLHLHTNMSDGSDSPIELLEKVEASGCKIFSVTDHDDLIANHIILKERKSKPYKTRFITGCEISSVFEGRNLHLLCYGFVSHSEGVKRMIDEGARLRKQRITAMFDHLRTRHNIIISEEGYKKAINIGQAPQYYVENNHPAIISQEIFDKANAILESRKWSRDSVAPIQKRSLLTGKIICGCCGTTYNRRTMHRGQGNAIQGWECSRYSSSGKASCPESKMIHDREFKELFLSAYNEAVKGGSAESQPVRIDEALRDLLSQERELSALRAKGYIPRQAYVEEQEKLVAQIKELEAEYAELTKRGDGVMKPETEYSDSLTRFLEEAKLNGLEVTFKFTNGAVIRRVMNSFRRKPREGK